MKDQNRSLQISNNIFPFPLPGQRIFRSVISIALCFVVDYLRGKSGTPFYSIVAALQCIQPDTVNTLVIGRKRITGTLVGAFWGSVILIGELRIADGAFAETPVHLLLLCIFTGIVLYSTVLFGISESAYFSSVVFLSIALNHITDVNPYLFVLNRTLDTIIGVGVAILVNSLHLPRIRDRETLFVSGVDHVLFREDRQLSSFTRIRLNRFISHGMRFSFSTKQTPATLRELTGGVDLRLPVIVMDGSVLYDMRTRVYLRTMYMDRQTAAELGGFLGREGYPYFINTIEENLLVIYYRGIDPVLLLEKPSSEAGSAAQAMCSLYHKKKNSPYRNYVHTEKDIVENVVYFLVTDRRERLEALYSKLMAQPWAAGCRAAFDTFDCEEGDAILRIHAAGATRRAMLEELRKYTGATRTVLFGNTPGECDVVIPDAGGGAMVRELKKRFEPVSLKGWKNILYF